MDEQVKYSFDEIRRKFLEMTKSALSLMKQTNSAPDVLSAVLRDVQFVPSESGHVDVKININSGARHIIVGGMVWPNGAFVPMEPTTVIGGFGSIFDEKIDKVGFLASIFIRAIRQA